MRLKEQTIHELEGLNPVELSKVYEMIRLVKSSRTQPESSRPEYFILAQEALTACSGSLANDIIHERGDRI